MDDFVAVPPRRPSALHLQALRMCMPRASEQAMSATFKLTAPKPYYPKEHDEQCFIFEWRKYAIKRWPELRLLHGTLNGVRVPIGLARKMKAAGMTRGLSDILLFVARGGFHGFLAELKREKGGQLSDDQIDFQVLAREQGYYAVTCKGAKACIAELEQYLQLPPTIVGNK